MKRIFSSLLAGVAAFFAFVVIGLLGTYIKCVGEGVHFDLRIAIRVVLKMAVYISIVMALLTFLTGANIKNDRRKLP
jgi:hypothetical protein